MTHTTLNRIKIVFHRITWILMQPFLLPYWIYLGILLLSSVLIYIRIIQVYELYTKLGKSYKANFTHPDIEPFNVYYGLKQEKVRDSVIYLENGLWQLTRHPLDRSRIYIHSFYYDDRNPVMSYMVSFIMADGSLDQSGKVYCLGWYNNRVHPLYFKGKLTNIAISTYVLRGLHYTPYMVKCGVTATNYNEVSLPVNISLIFGPLHEHEEFINTLFPVVYEEYDLHASDFTGTRNLTDKANHTQNIGKIRETYNKENNKHRKEFLNSNTKYKVQESNRTNVENIYSNKSKVNTFDGRDITNEAYLDMDHNNLNKINILDRNLKNLTRNQKHKNTTNTESTYSNQRIAVCMAAQYGYVNDTDAFFFIQWIEALQMFGVSEIIMYNSSLITEGKYFDKVIQYYRHKGVLQLHQLPSPLCYKNQSENYLATESIRYHSVNDCFYRNYHKYWYILHIDRDELPVPKIANTYQGFLQHHLQRDENRTKDISIAMRSAFFYTYYPPANKFASELMPLNRYTYRLPSEKHTTRYAAFSKSFINTKLCTVVWSHRCLFNHYVLVPESEILVHHYRSSCRMGMRCKYEWRKRFIDNFVLLKFGVELEKKTLSVFEDLDIKL